jgi:TRAP-type C4-dicarboxylate transport system permease small subunit
MFVLRTLVDRLISLSTFTGAVALTVVMGVILADVIGRAFGHPLFGSHDIVTMTMSLIVFGGMALCDYRGGHISVDLLERHFPGALNRIVDIFSAVAGSVIFAGIAWYVYDYSKISVMLNRQTNLLDLPVAWFQWAIAALALVTSLAMLLRAVELVLLGKDVRKSPEEPSA